MPDHEHHIINEDKATAIARGEDGFSSETRLCEFVPTPTVNRLLTFSVIGLAVIVVVAIGALLALSIYRGQERHSFDRQLNLVDDELKLARAQRDKLQATLETTNAGVICRAQSQLDVDRQQANVLVVIAEQFATTLDRVPPAPDPNAVSAAAAALQSALDARSLALTRCAGNYEPPGG
jgi:Tfp pilus assembly protein PilX